MEVKNKNGTVVKVQCVTKPAMSKGKWLDTEGTLDGNKVVFRHTEKLKNYYFELNGKSCRIPAKVATEGLDFTTVQKIKKEKVTKQ